MGSGLFNKDSITKYLIAASLILIASIVGKKFKRYFDDEAYSPNDYKLIKQYLLNDDLYHSGKPNLWIHSKYEINARAWKSFGSRNTYDLNQPYLHLTIKSIIHHCEKSFNICLIDDATFGKLLPGWNIKMDHLAEPFRTHYRELGMLKLIYEYGGMVVPNSFLCFRDLIHLYSPEKVPFVAENVNRASGTSLDFTPDIRFIGAQKKCPVINDLVLYISTRNAHPHYSAESDFTGAISMWCMDRVRERKIKLLSADMIGAMSATNKKPILLDHLMEEQYLDIPTHAMGIFIPADEILNRPKYQWFSVISSDEVLNGTTILSKYFINTIGGIHDTIAATAAVEAVAMPQTSI